MFQSLSLEPGGHEITVYLEGFRSIRQQRYLNAGSTYCIEIRQEGCDAFVTAVEIRRGEVTPLNVSLARS